jgi:hypothetical protein
MISGKTMQKVMYHGSCPDGMGAAIAAYVYFRDKLGYKETQPFQLDGVEFTPMHYGAPIPAVNEDDDLYILDFSFDEDVTKSLADKAKSVTVIDHHLTAKNNLSLLGRTGEIVFIFDNDRSGVGLAWDIFMGERPPLVDYLEDYDLWNLNIPLSGGMVEAACSRPMTIEGWLPLFDGTVPFETLYAEAATLWRHKMVEADKIISTSRPISGLFGFKEPINVACCPHFIASDVNHILCKDKPFSMTFEINLHANNLRLSFRSRKDTENSIDVEALAETLGGGGHKHCAGATFPLNSHHARSLLSQLSQPDQIVASVQTKAS